MKKYKISFEFENEDLTEEETKEQFKSLFPNFKNLEIEEIKPYFPTDEEIILKLCKRFKSLNSEYVVYRQSKIINGVCVAENYLNWVRYIKNLNYWIKKAKDELIEENK